MGNGITELFDDDNIIIKIKNRLPFMFQLADIESSRAGQIGMEVGSIRERIIVALLIHKFGEHNVNTEIPITEKEIDVILFGNPISIKTISSKTIKGVKLSWTVDMEKSGEFKQEYIPKCNIIYVQVNWGGIGYIYYFPLTAQKKVLSKMGRDNYIILPKPGTNPRGSEITRKALLQLVEEPDTRKIEISWEKKDLDYDPYKRWLDYWKE